MAPGRLTSMGPCVQNSFKGSGAEAGGSAPRHLPQLQRDCTDEDGRANNRKALLPFTSVASLDFSSTNKCLSGG